MSFLMSFALEPEIVTLAWVDNASLRFPLNIYATLGLIRANLASDLGARGHQDYNVSAPL